MRIPLGLPSAGEEADDSDGVSLSEEVSTDDEEPPDASQEGREGNSIKVGDRMWKLDTPLRSKKHRGYSGVSRILGEGGGGGHKWEGYPRP